MAVDPASVLAALQVARVMIDLVQAHEKGELTEEENDAAWATVHAQAATARQSWEQSKTVVANAAKS